LFRHLSDVTDEANVTADAKWLTDRFEENRGRLSAIALRMLGSRAEADDAVQEAWLRLRRADVDAIENLGGWLTTVVARVCLDMLRSRRSRREESLDGVEVESSSNPEQHAVLADSIGAALIVVLETLTPSERVAFVLHDLFAMPFDEIAPIVGRTPTATRQLASRARRRVQGRRPVTPTDLDRRRQVVDAFLAASRGGDFGALLELLHPDAVVRADEEVVRMGSPREVRGAVEVARTFAGRARAAQPVLVDGEPALVWSSGGRPRVIFRFTITDGRVAAIQMVADPEVLSRLVLS
jgi:RNA polymerase sigma-70 factor (ECF subfamily)